MNSSGTCWFWALVFAYAGALFAIVSVWFLVIIFETLAIGLFIRSGAYLLVEFGGKRK